MADPAIVDSIAEHIANIESAGDYAAKGPATASGDRAYGKYQIMGANIPSWTKEALGTEMAPDAFIADPDAQEKTAKHRLTKYYDETGNARDVASMWHSGQKYDDAVREGRTDSLGTTTKSYADRVATAVETPTAPTEAASPPPSADTLVALPDGTNINLGPDPTPELKAQVKAKIMSRFPDLAQQAGTSTTVTPTSDTPPASPTGPTLRDQSVDDVASSLNKQAGQPDDHWFGKYTAALGKPAADALHDVYTAITQANPESTGNPMELSTWKDALNRSLKALHPLGVPAEAAGNVAYQAAIDAGMGVNVASLLGATIGAGTGYFTPVPGLKVPETPSMPLQGTKATRQMAQDAESAATQAETSSTAATAPSAAATTQATEALTPQGISPAVGGQTASKALESKLAEVKEPVQGIYNAVTEKATAEGRTLAASDAKPLADQIASIKEELGSTLSGAPKKVLDDLESKIASNEPLSYKDLDTYKQQLDTMFPGRKPPMNATPKTRAMYDFKWDVRDKMRTMVSDEDRPWLEAADSLWRDTIIGKDNPHALGNLVRLAKKDPNTFAERVFGNGTSDKQAAYAKSVMQALGNDAAPLKEAVLARAINSATDSVNGDLDPKKLLSAVGKYSKGFYDSIVGPAQDAFLKELKSAQSAATEAGPLRAAADKAAAIATQPNKLAYLTAKGIEIAGTEALGRTIGHLPGGGALGLFIPAQGLAKVLADSKTANLLVRAMRTGVNSPAVPAIISALRNRNTSTNFLAEKQ